MNPEESKIAANNLKHVKICLIEFNILNMLFLKKQCGTNSPNRF